MTAGSVEKAIQQIPAIGKNWPIPRKLIGFVQILALRAGLDPGKVDGFIGPQTLLVFDKLIAFKLNGSFPANLRDDSQASSSMHAISRNENPNNWPTYDQMNAVFGKPGTHLITVKAPYQLRLAWDTATKVYRFTCHKKVATSLTGILESIRDHHGEKEVSHLGLDLFGGTYNYRKMRGGDLLSTHAWGAAIDLDPMNNQLRWDHTEASFAKPAYQFTRDAFAKEGWVSLGEAKDYDWMHFQAVRL